MIKIPYFRKVLRPLSLSKLFFLQRKSISNDFGIDTLYVSTEPNPHTGAISPSLEFSTTFERDKFGELSRGYNYSRLGNPTRREFENIFSKVEKGVESFAFSSGMQAGTAILMACPGSHVLLPDDLYHGIHVIAKDLLCDWGLTIEKVDMTNHFLVRERLTAAVSSISQQDGVALKKRVILWLETPSNPQCKVTDIQTLSELAHNLSDRVVVAVDSTWATPYLLNPLALGADIVMHSLTKYIGGHSDVLGGVVTSSARLHECCPDVSNRIRTFHQIGGGVCGPWEAWMAMRGLRTLPVRMRQHCSSALYLASQLEKHPCVERVFYPGLPSHPQHELAARQMGNRCVQLLHSQSLI
jgi:cystathionine gamma-synthase